jgi:hypothetical protein
LSFERKGKVGKKKGGKRMVSQDMQSLIEKIKKSSLFRISKLAKKFWKKSSQESIDDLLRLLKDDDFSYRYRAGKIFAEMPAKDDYISKLSKDMLEVMEDCSLSVKKSVIYTIGDMRGKLDPMIYERLAWLLKNDTNWEVRYMIIDAFQKMPFKKMRSKAFEALKMIRHCRDCDRNEKVRKRAKTFSRHVRSSCPRWIKKKMVWEAFIVLKPRRL